MGYVQAVEKTIDECIREGILTDFFRTKRVEVASVSIFEYDEERYIQMVREEAREEACEEAREEAPEEAREERVQQIQKEIREVLRLKDILSPEKTGEVLEVEASLVKQICHIAEESPEISAEAIYNMIFPENEVI